MNTNHDDEDFTRELLKAAGPRPPLPEGDLAAITNAAHAVWRKRYASPWRRFAHPVWLPIAATLVIGIALAVWISTRRPVAAHAPTAVMAASVESISGTVALSPGESLFTGSVVETTDAASRVALRLKGGQSLRLDGGTRARLVTPTVVELQRGGLYVDSTQLDDLTIRTGAGLFTPIGTQFEVRVGAGETQLRVREGRVAFHHGQARDIAAVGDELSIGVDGKIARARVRADDSRWQWAVDMARIPPIEGRTLEWFLRLCAREKGWKLAYASGSTAALASKTVLHGSVDGLPLDDALRTVALSSGVDYRVRNGMLTVTVN